MTSSKDIVDNILNLNDDEFFSQDPKMMRPRKSQLLRLDYFGIAINSPVEITIDDHDRLPLVMAAQYSGERGWDIPIKENCILVGTNLEDGTVKFSKAFINKKAMRNRGKKEILPKGPKPSGLAKKAVVISRLDPFDLLSMQWEAGKWAFGVLYYDWPSNPITIELKGEKSVTPSPVLTVHPDPNPRGTGFLPCYLPTAQTPHPPESGLVFKGELKMDEKQQLNIFGSFNIKTRKFHLPKETLVHQFDDGIQQTISAVIPATLTVLRLDWKTPLRFDWRIPVYGEPLGVGMPATGYFSLNALADHGGFEPGQYILYIILDGQIFGPKILKLN